MKYCTLFVFLLPLVCCAQYNQQERKNEAIDLRVPVAETAKISKANEWVRAMRVPTALIALGIYSMKSTKVINRMEIREERNEYLPHFRHHADNYLQFAPAAAVYGLNALGIKGKNTFANRTAILVKAEIIMIAIVYPLKKLTAVPRPDTGQPTSFPSGHTAEAFAAATFLSKEYGSQSIWYSVGAYTVATGIGVMRVLNNRHWISDVFAGAGIGILSTEIAYLTHQYKWGGKNRRALVMPTYSGGSGAGIYFNYRFK
ncbi:MAG TPA: phosphatase PAP2 family protein [Ohtaekwangia sp.]|uniref:phosphatase PAP2 family protein n=1 Tax=Ohtaekwangia sp. TaxID=2066019 RepID=UPI002F94F979